MSPEDKALCAKIQSRANELLRDAPSSGVNYGAVNWGDLSATEVARCELVDDTVQYRVVVEEASPSCGLPAPLSTALSAEFGVVVVVQTEW